MEHLETMKTQAGNLPPNTILSGFQGAAVSTHLPCDTRGPFLLGDSALSGSGSISGRTRSSQDLEELRQKPLDFVFLVEWERAVAPEGWAELSTARLGAPGAKSTGTTAQGRTSCCVQILF